MLPRATLTAGATWTTVFTDGLEIASHTFWISLRAVMAPVGHATAHWPQPTHMVSERGFPKAVEMSILEPRKAKSIAPTFCTSWQVLTQSPQRMHLPESKTIEADELVTLLSSALFGKRTPSMLKRTARSWSLQDLLLAHVVQSRQWLARRSSRMFFLYFLRRAVLVFMLIPALGGVEHAV